MCKETDEEPQKQVTEEKPKTPKGLPEPGKPTPIPKDAMIPPAHQTRINKSEPTIAQEEVFTDKDLSSINAEA